VTVLGLLILTFIFFLSPLSTETTDRIVAYATVVALLLNAYAWWDQGRKRRVELIGELRSCLIYLQARTAYYVAPERALTGPDVDAIRGIYDETAKKLVDALYRNGAFVSGELYTKTIEFLKQLQLFAENRRVAWEELLEESEELRGFVDREIERYKLHRLFMPFLQSSLVEVKK
jgi:hypothetical protein